MRRYLQVLRARRFRLLWLGATASSFGDGVSLLALIWLVYVTGGSATKLGWFVAAYTAPVVVGGPLVGAALDCFDRRLIMIADNLMRGVVVGLLPLLSYHHALHLWQLYGFAVLYGFLKMIPLAGVPTVIPDLVAAEDFDAANALESISFYLSAIAGPAAAGLLIAEIGAINVLWLDAASYFAFAFALVRVGPLPRAPRAEHAEARTIRHSLRFRDPCRKAAARADLRRPCSWSALPRTAYRLGADGSDAPHTARHARSRLRHHANPHASDAAARGAARRNPPPPWRHSRRSRRDRSCPHRPGHHRSRNRSTFAD